MIENSKDLCNFYCDLIEQISELSFFVEKDGKLVFSKDMKNHPYKSSSQKFSEEASEKIRNFFQAEMTKSWKRKRNGSIYIYLINLKLLLIMLNSNFQIF